MVVFFGNDYHYVSLSICIQIKFIFRIIMYNNEDMFGMQDYVKIMIIFLKNNLFIF